MKRSLLRRVHLPGVVCVRLVRRNAKPPPSRPARHRSAVRDAPDHLKRARAARVPQIRLGPASLAVRWHGRGQRRRQGDGIRAGQRGHRPAGRLVEGALWRRDVAHERSALHVHPDEEQRAQFARHAEQLLVQCLRDEELRMVNKSITNCSRTLL